MTVRLLFIAEFKIKLYISFDKKLFPDSHRQCQFPVLGGPALYADLVPNCVPIRSTGTVKVSLIKARM